MNRLVQEQKASRKCNWSKWRLIPEVTVWQAVTLSLDIDPDSIDSDSVWLTPQPWMSSPSGFVARRDFRDRLDVACANVGRGRALPALRYGGDDPNASVRLKEFAAWCLSIDWSIPDELRALAGASTQSVAPSTQDAHGQQNAQIAAQVAKFANEAGYAQLVASVDAKDLHLNLAPDWPHWANMAYVTVSDAACLSLGISPEAQLPKINLSDVHGRAQAANVDSTRAQLGIAALERAQRIIQQRVQQAMSAIGAGELPHGPRSIHEILSGSAPALVSLPRFRRWAESLPEPYAFPDGFPPAEPYPKLAVYSSAQPDVPGTEEKKPLREPERGNWLAIIHALAEMANLPERGAASSVERQLQELGYETPRERTIRDVLNEARRSKD